MDFGRHTIKIPGSCKTFNFEGAGSGKPVSPTRALTLRWGYVSLYLLFMRSRLFVVWRPYYWISLHAMSPIEKSMLLTGVHITGVSMISNLLQCLWLSSFEVLWNSPILMNIAYLTHRAWARVCFYNDETYANSSSYIEQVYMIDSTACYKMARPVTWLKPHGWITLLLYII